MDRNEAAVLTKLKMLEHKLTDWTFDWNSRKRHCGLCHSYRKTIYLSRYYVDHNTVEVVLTTILHEIAHALVGCRVGHGPEWKRVCAEIGGVPRRVNTAAIMPVTFKRQYKCSKCGHIFNFHRKLQDESSRWHRGCGPSSRLIRIK